MKSCLCNVCGVAITDDTYVVNWGSCDPCYDHQWHMWMQDGCDPCDEWPCDWDDRGISIDDMFD